MSFCFHIDTVTCPNCAWIGMAIPPWAFPPGAPQAWTTATEPEEVEDETAEDDPPDPPKCHECNGKGKIDLMTSVVDCDRCGGSGY